MTMLDIITYRIKKVLTDEGWSQSELARRIGISQQTVQKWVSGITSPTTSNMDKLSEITGYPIYWFMLPPEGDDQVATPESMKLSAKQQELLRIFSEFPDEEQDSILKELQAEKERMQEMAERWLNAKKRHST
ncbi:helix-turn-helix domain-containing protein [Salmonella enterica subsp. enterica serovar Newport]|nr:helix-turn-helix domain-containing protein [Salmonella enterica subsp. enterica serovar Newport]EJW0497007.1 helix-turn-helix domain-containing protein [Salmonella enterica subsp. enterica serovar Newport]ELA5318502.1 helix-turn-helix domain-containing protein [Salmonella enterica subsp. enterica serovar Newport]